MGRSINVVFGRLAQKHLTPDDLLTMGGAFGFGSAVPFPVPNEASKIEIPQEALEFAKTLRDIPVYPAASTYEFHGDLTKLASNETPFAPHPAVLEAIARTSHGNRPAVARSAGHLRFGRCPRCRRWPPAPSSSCP